MPQNPNNPPGVGVEQEIADAYFVFLETVAQLTGLDLYDFEKPDDGGLIGVCVLVNPPIGHTSNWSNAPPLVQAAILGHHLRLQNSVVEYGVMNTRKPS